MTEKAREAVREHPGHQARRRFMLGKYEIIAQPIAGSAHMLRYTVFVGGRRIPFNQQGIFRAYPELDDRRNNSKKTWTCTLIQWYKEGCGKKHWTGPRTESKR